MVLVRLPPPPAAILVLEVAEPLRPSATCRSSSDSRSVGASFSCVSARVTTTLGRKLESVCSVQPYGNDGQVVERAEQRPGHRRRERHATTVRDAGIRRRGNRDLGRLLRRRRAACRSRRLRGAGRRAAPASAARQRRLSASVRAVAVTVAVPTADARKRQSSRRSPPLRDRCRSSASGGAASVGVEALGRERDARRPSRRADSCARSSAATT